MSAEIVFLKMVKIEDLVKCHCGSGDWNRWVDRAGVTWCMSCIGNMSEYWREVHTDEELQSEVTVQAEIDTYFGPDDEMDAYHEVLHFDDVQRTAKITQKIQQADDCSNPLKD